MILIEECLRNFELIANLRFEAGALMSNFSEIPFLGDPIELSDIFLDISSAIDSTEFTDSENRILKHIMRGYNYSEISNLTGINSRLIPEHFATICNKLLLRLNEDYITKLTEK